MDDRAITYCCVPPEITPDKLEARLTADPAHCDLLLQEIRDTADGKYVGRNNISPEGMRAMLPKLEKHTAYYKSRALFVRFVDKLSKDPTATSHPDKLAALTRDADLMMDQVLDLAEPERTQMGTLLYQNLVILRQLAPLADADDHDETVILKLHRTLTGAIGRWLSGQRSPEFRAYCTELLDALSDPQNELTAEDRERFKPHVDKFRAVIKEDSVAS